LNWFRLWIGGGVGDRTPVLKQLKLWLYMLRWCC